MPTIHDLKSSRFLTKEDCGKGLLLTIKGYHQENVARKDEPEENKWCVDFMETDKPLVLNQTRGETIAQICGSEDFDDWKGNKIVLFLDPLVKMAGKMVGGIGVRAPRNIAPAPRPPGPQPPPPKPTPRPPKPEPVPEPETVPPEEDDVPF